jgi:hypothetical protein
LNDNKKFIKQFRNPNKLQFSYISQNVNNIPNFRLMSYKDISNHKNMRNIKYLNYKQRLLKKCNSQIMENKQIFPILKINPNHLPNNLISRSNGNLDKKYPLIQNKSISNSKIVKNSQIKPIKIPNISSSFSRNINIKKKLSDKGIKFENENEEKFKESHKELSEKKNEENIQKSGEENEEKEIILNDNENMENNDLEESYETFLANNKEKNKIKELSPEEITLIKSLFYFCHKYDKIIYIKDKIEYYKKIKNLIDISPQNQKNSLLRTSETLTSTKLNNLNKNNEQNFSSSSRMEKDDNYISQFREILEELYKKRI